MHFQEAVSKIIRLDQVSDQKKITAIKKLFLADNDPDKVVLEIKAENDAPIVPIMLPARNWKW